MQRFPSVVLDAAREIAGTVSNTPSRSSTPSLDMSTLKAQLTTLKFRQAHIDSALLALQAAHARLHSSSSSIADPLVLSLSILSPLEAAIEWLLLHLPEDDLPHRYRPTSSSSDFVTGASVSNGGQSALVKSWLLDKLVKQAGFPRKAVERVLVEDERQSVALDILGRRLCGWESGENGWGAEEYSAYSGDGQDHDRQMMRDEEITAIEAVLGERYRRISTGEHEIYIAGPNNDSITLYIILDEASPYPSPEYPTYPPSFYITSPSLPAYMRLQLHALLLRQFRDPERHDLRSVLESGAGGAVLGMVEYLESALPDIISNPPDVGQVMRYLVSNVDGMIDEPRTAVLGTPRKPRETHKRRLPAIEDNETLRRKQKSMIDSSAYKSILENRERLPAWKERENIVRLLEANRVLVVVGEVSQSISSRYFC